MNIYLYKNTHNINVLANNSCREFVIVIFFELRMLANGHNKLHIFSCQSRLILTQVSAGHYLTLSFSSEPP